MKFTRHARWVRIAIGVSYPLALLLAWLLLRFSGESWWPPLVGLYMPPAAFLLPAPVAIIVAWRWAGIRWLALQLVAAALALFGLLGLGLGFGRDAQAARDPAAIHLVSFNIHQGFAGVPNIVAQVMKLKPNLILLQEADDALDAPLRAAFPGWQIDRRDQFFIASSFPILEVREPARLHYQVGDGGVLSEREGGAHYMAYTLDTTLGPVDVFNVHTSSPREGLEGMRGQGFLYELRHGHFRFGQDAARLTFNAYRRRRQVEAVAAAARASKHPVIIAGDFNLPALSHIVRDNLGDFDEAFTQAGRGFGYTYPSKLPFLRIDRVFTSRALRTVDFHVGHGRASDHASVSAVLVPAGQ